MELSSVDNFDFARIGMMTIVMLFTFINFYLLLSGRFPRFANI